MQLVNDARKLMLSHRFRSLDSIPPTKNALSQTKEWVPYWTDLSDVSQASSLLLHCGCSVACKENCNCHRAGLRCSSLCKCEGGCINNDKEGYVDHGKDVLYCGADIKLIKLIIFTYYIAGHLVQIYFQ